jgi:hypothetical protein
VYVVRALGADCERFGLDESDRNQQDTFHGACRESLAYSSIGYIADIATAE